MSRRYEALLALDNRGKEESAKDIIERIEKEFAQQGVTVEQTQRLERREFAYKHNHLSHAYFVNFIINAGPQQIDTLRAKFKLDEEITLQQYTRLPEAKPAPAAA